MTAERRFKEAVHRRLRMRHPGVYFQAAGGRAGTPDCYYEAPGGKLVWVEYKVHPNRCSTLQQLWIERAWKNAVPALVVTAQETKNWGPIRIQTGPQWGVADMKEDCIDDYIEVLAKMLGVRDD